MKTDSREQTTPINGETPADDMMDALLRDYFPEPQSWRALFRDEEEALLTALLLESREESRLTGTTEQSEEATYDSITVTVDADGPVNDRPNIDGAKIDLGGIYNGVTLRFTDAIEAAFKSEDDDRWIPYGSRDSPVTGIQAETRFVWVRRGDSATTDPQVNIEVGL